MRFSQEFIEKVSEANNLVDIVAQYTQLKRSGTQLMGRCPFPDHAEKTPSFSVSETKQVYHCFGCGKSGNLFSFLRDYQGMSFPEAVEYLADRANLELPAAPTLSAQNQEEIKKEKRKKILEANKWALFYFRESLKILPNQHPVRAYLAKRGLDATAVQTFQVGYAPAEWDGLVQFLQSKKISLQVAEEAQLIKPKQGGGYFDLFRERLMFPIFNHLAEPIAFGGRIILDGQPKYLNSPETLVFSKSRTLYGLHETAKYIRSEDAVVIVEGYMDAVALYQAGIKNVVAIMGTALTADHCRMIKRMTPHVHLLLDGDQAGQTAAERSLPLLLSQGLYPRGLILPDGLDPDDFVKKFGPQELQNRLGNSEDLFKVVMRSWMMGYKGEAQQKVQLADRARPLFEAMADQRLKKLYIQELANQMRVAIPWLVEALGGKAQFQRNSEASNVVNKNNQAANPVPDLSEIQLTSAPYLERVLVSLAIKSRANFTLYLESKLENFLIHAGVKSVLKIAEELYRQGPEKFDKLLSLLVTKVDTPEVLFFNDRAMRSYNPSVGIAATGNESWSQHEESVAEDEFEKETQILKDCFQRIRETGLRDQLKKLALELKERPQAETVEKMKRLQDEIRDLKKS